MAGSLNHIIGDDGKFTMELIENLGDAHEALHECYQLIIELSGGDKKIVDAAQNRIYNSPTDHQMIPTKADW